MSHNTVKNLHVPQHGLRGHGCVCVGSRWLVSLNVKLFNVSMRHKNNEVITCIIHYLLDCWSNDLTDSMRSSLGILEYRDLTSIGTRIVVCYLNMVAVY